MWLRGSVAKRWATGKARIRQMSAVMSPDRKKVRQKR